MDPIRAREHMTENAARGTPSSSIRCFTSSPPKRSSKMDN